jgi:hypothetical protein
MTSAAICQAPVNALEGLHSRGENAKVLGAMYGVDASATELLQRNMHYAL